MPCSIRSLRWALIGGALAFGVGLLAQAPVPVTVGWSNDPSFAGLVSWTVQRTDTGVSVPCGQVQPGPTWRCTASLPLGSYPIRLRGTRTDTSPPLVGAWSASVPATIGAPGALVLVHAEAFKAPPMGFTSEETFTTDASQAGTADSSNFPVPIKVTDNALKTVGNGGFVTSSSGYDIRPYSDVALATALTYELVYYDGTTGTLEMWVKFSTLSHTTNITSYLAFGNSALTTDGSSSATWPNYSGVWHFPNGSSLTTVNSVTGVAASANTATAGTGQIDGGASFDGISTKMTTDLTAFTPIAQGSYSAWVNRTGVGSNNNAKIISLNATPDLGNSEGDTPKHYTLFASGTSGQGSWTIAQPSASTFHHIVIVYDGSSASNDPVIYVDGTSVSVSNVARFTGSLATTAVAVVLGNRNGDTARPFQGVLDEFSIYNGLLSSSWVTASYNSQKTGSTFLTWGSRTAFGFGALLGGQRDRLARGF